MDVVDVQELRPFICNERGGKVNSMQHDSDVRSPLFVEILGEMRDVHDRKNADYSGSDQPDPFRNFRECEDFGVSAFEGVMVRLSDKWMRIKNLARTKVNAVKDESIEDTLLDMANYSVIALAILREARARTYVDPVRVDHLIIEVDED